MRNAFATLVLVILIVVLAVYDLVTGLYFYGSMAIAALVWSIRRITHSS